MKHETIYKMEYIKPRNGSLKLAIAIVSFSVETKYSTQYAKTSFDDVQTSAIST